LQRIKQKQPPSSTLVRSRCLLLRAHRTSAGQAAFFAQVSFSHFGITMYGCNFTASFEMISTLN
jgi:hypothetical protein